MWHWTLKSLMAQPLALIASITTAASAFLLVMVFEAVYAGEAEQVVAYISHADADVWVMQKGVSNMHMATSYLSDWKVTQVRDVPGVAAVDGILYLNTVVESGAQPWFSFIVGLDVPNTRAGPWAMAEGRALPGAGEAVVPAVFARMTDLALGGSLRIADNEFTVVGLSAGTFSMANSVIFLTKSDLEDIMDSLDIVSYILVKAEPGIDPVALANEIERQVDKVTALSSAQFVFNDKSMAIQMGVETIALMTLIGGALAVLLVAFAVYSLIARQRRELAVVKALGASNRAVYLSVALQAAGITLASIVLATVLAAILMPAATALIPQLTLKLTLASIGRIAVVGAAVALIASLIPARQVARVDPLSAFHA